MEKRRIGKYGPLVSPIGLGCVSMSSYYGSSSDEQSIDVLKKAIDLGVTHFDTADTYGWGHNEEIIGKAIKGQRDKIVLATKMGFVQGKSPSILDSTLDGSPAYVKKACDLSLKRLGVEMIDLYYLHRVDPKTPVENTIQAMAELIKEGKIRYIGLSEVTTETLRRAASVHQITALQTEYSLWERAPEKEIIPTCEELGIGFVAFSPLGRGLLTGKVTSDGFSEKDVRRFLPRFQGDNFAHNYTLVQKLEEIAQEKKCSLSQLALAWLLAKPTNIIPIPGTKRIEYLEENIHAVDIKLSQTDVDRIEKIFPLNVAMGEKYPGKLYNER